MKLYSTARVFFQKSSPAGGEQIRVERIKFWNPTVSSPVPVDSQRSRDESPGMIKSDSQTPRATDFWGRASVKLPPGRPRTSVFLWPVLSKADVF